MIMWSIFNEKSAIFMLKRKVRIAYIIVKKATFYILFK